MDLASELTGHPGHRFQLLATGAEKAVWGPEVAQQGSLPGRSDTADTVENRRGHRLIAATAVEGDREAVRLVADPLQQPQGVRSLLQQDRVAPPGYEHLLDPFGEAD